MTIFWVDRWKLLRAEGAATQPTPDRSGHWSNTEISCLSVESSLPEIPSNPFQLDLV